jgi:PadR family transcriptional regulator, regulatory protein AphA
MKMNSLHYVLLAGIDAAPSSGYDLKLWLANLGRHFWAAEHSSIYPALQQLQAAGFLTHREKPSSAKRDKLEKSIGFRRRVEKS